MRAATFLLLFILSVYFGNAQPSVQYQLNLDNIRHHELKINVKFNGIRKDTLTITMPNASPGRYAEHNFVKNVYEVQAFNKEGRKTEFARVSPYSWKIPVKDGFAQFSYTLYGNHADGTYTGIDAKKLHMNMPATFVYGEDLTDIPINLVIDLSERPNWTVATQLVKTNDSTFSAPDYYYFYDSPTMVGEIELRSWKVDNQTIEVAIMHEGSNAELDAYVDWIKKIVLEEKEIFGSLPEFDYGRYTFLVSYNQWVYGDGMEHRNSTICSSNGNLKDNAQKLIGTVSHEFFHAWNIERIRPESLEPFDFDKANMSGELWFGEGFTSYYDGLVLARTKILSPEQYINSLTGTMNYVINSPGRAIRNPIQMSYNAPFVDAATAIDETNYQNNFVSYYSYGSVLGLGLDLLMRTKFKNITLDDYMKYVWQKYGQPEIPYTIPQLQEALSTVTKDEDFAESFFNNYVYDSKLPDFKTLLPEFGVTLEPLFPESTDLINVKLDNAGIIVSSVLRNHSLYEAGIEKGDQIISLDGQEIWSFEDFKNAAQRLAAGRSYTIQFKQLGEIISTNFTAKPDQTFKVAYIPDAQLSKKVQKKRNAWLKVE